MFKINKNKNLQINCNIIKLEGCEIISKLIILVCSLCNGISNIKNISKHKNVINLIRLIENFNINIIQKNNLTIVNGKNIKLWRQSENVINIHNNTDILHYLVNILCFKNFRTFITGDNDFVKNNIVNFNYLKNNNFIFKDEEKHLPLLLNGNYKLQKNNFKIYNTLEKNSLLFNFLSNLNIKNIILDEQNIQEEYLEKILNFYGLKIKENQFENRNFLTGERIKCKELEIVNNGEELSGKDFIVPANLNEVIYTIFLGLILDLNEFYIENVSVNEFNNEILKILIENGVDIEFKNQKILNSIKTIDISVKNSKLKPLSISKNRLLKIQDTYPILIMLNIIKKNELKILGIKNIKNTEKNNYNFLIYFLTSINVMIKDDKDLLELNSENINLDGINEITINEHVDEKIALAIYLSNIIFNKKITFKNNIDLLNIFPNIYNIFELFGIEIIND